MARVGRPGETSVLVVYPQLPHYRYGVFSELDRGPLTVTFAAGSVAREGIELIPPGVLRETVELRNRWFGRVLWQSGLLSLLARRRFDHVILLGDASVASYWLALLLLRLQRRSVWLWTIGWHRPETGLRRLVRLAFYRLARGLLLYGTTARSIGTELGYPADRMCVIGNSAVSLVASGSSELPSQVEKALGTIAEGGRFVIGAVIRLSPQKGLDLVIEAAALLQQQDVPVSVLLVGDGPCRADLTRRAAELGVDLHMPGAVYGEQCLARVYEVLDLTVVPRAVGLTAVQSMAHGTPVVSDDDVYAQMPEWEAILPGQTGGYYESGDVRSLAERLVTWRDKLACPESSDEIAAACEAEVRRGWEPVGHADRIADALLRADEKRRR